MKGLVTYFLDYVMKNLLLPGQVENWVVITDLENVGIMNLPYSLLQEVFSFMQNNFRGRMYRAYILDAPWTFSAAWNVLKTFMEGSTASKVSICSDRHDPGLKDHINMSQIEKKIGGNMENLTTYWPPSQTSTDYSVPTNPTLLLAESEYKAMANQGMLQGCKVSPFLV